MGAYRAAVVTAAGQNIIAQALADVKAVEFTSAKTSSYLYPSGTNITGLTGLQDVEQSVIPFAAQVMNGNVVQVSVRFDNDEITQQYPINTIGLYAKVKDGEEVLFSVIQAIIPDEMPVHSDVSPSAFIYNIQHTVQNAAQITIVVNPAGTATVQDIYGLTYPEFEDYSAEGAEAPDARTAIEEIKSKKSIFGIMSNIKAALKGLVTLGEMKELLVNNGLCNIPGQYFLDAAFGKNLQDQVTDVNNNLNGYKIYTSISQLGLSTYSSIVQLVNTLPSNSILTFTITNSEWEQSLYPMLWGEVFIQKYSTRARIIFTSQQISSDDNYAYIKYTNYNDETNWAKIILDTTLNPNEMWQFTNKNAISIPEGADMQNLTYLDLGVYKCDTGERAATLKNCPTRDAFVLFVYRTLDSHAKYITQEFRTINNEIYKRYYNGYDVDNQVGTGWKNDVKIVTSPGLGINAGIELNSGCGVYAQVGTDNDYTRFVVNNKWVAIEHFTNGAKDKTIPLWDGK